MKVDKEAVAALAITVAVGIGIVVAANVGDELQELRLQVADCQEDENWDVVDYRTPGATEDIHGVTRMCVHVDE